MKRVFFASVFAVILLTGCTVIRELPPETLSDKTQSAAIQSEEYEICRKLLTAFLKDDAETFVAMLPDEVQKKFGVKEFATTRKQVVNSLGQPVSFAYVTKLELAPLTPHIWKVRFVRTGIRKKDETFRSEALFRVITGKVNGKAVITSFQFI